MQRAHGRRGRVRSLAFATLALHAGNIWMPTETASAKAGSVTFPFQA